MQEKLSCLLICPYRDKSQFYSQYPLLGIGYVASALKKRNISVAILDANSENGDISIIIDRIKKLKPRIIGFSVIYYSLRFTYKLIQKLKEEYPEGIIVAGGPHITVNPEIIFKMGIGYGFRGESEEVFADFCEAIIKGNNIPKNTKGMVINNLNNKIINEPVYVDDIDQVAPPAFDLYDLKLYRENTIGKKNIFTIISSRGCPFSCSFCDKKHRRPLKFNNIEYVIKQIKQLKNLGIRNIDFVDEIFTINKERVAEFCNRIINENIKISWGCWTRVDHLDKELLILMKAAGLKRLLFGVETGNEQLRFRINKKISNESYINAVNLCNRLNISTECTFIIGHPGENLNMMMDTISFAKRLKPSISYFFLLHVIPASEVFELFKAEDNKSDDYFEKYMTEEEQIPLYIPKNFNLQELYNIMNKAYKSFYYRPSRFLKIYKSRFIKERLSIFGSKFILRKN